MIDNLGGRLGSFDRLEKELPDGSNWSGWDRVLGGGAWFQNKETFPSAPPPRNKETSPPPHPDHPTLRGLLGG
jgi:hypothetical protein